MDQNMNFIELVDIEDYEVLNRKYNMVDVSIEDDESFVLAEEHNYLISHNSANASVKNCRDTKTMGSFPLRGKPLNTYGMKPIDIMNNEEFKNIISILGLSLTDKTLALENMRYGIVGLFADADVDGSHIKGLLINFFNNWPELFENHRIAIVNSPRYVVTHKDKSFDFYYSTEEFLKVQNKLKSTDNVRYIKGLGSLRDKEMKAVLADRSHLEYIEIDDMEALKIMFSSDSAPRKKLLTQEVKA